MSSRLELGGEGRAGFEDGRTLSGGDHLVGLDMGWIWSWWLRVRPYSGTDRTFTGLLTLSAQARSRNPTNRNHLDPSQGVMD